MDFTNQKNEEFEETFEKYKQNQLRNIFQQIDEVVKSKIDSINQAEQELLKLIPEEILETPAENILKKKYNLVKVFEQLEKTKVKNNKRTPQKHKNQQFFATSPRKLKGYTPQKKIITSKKKIERLMFLSKDKNWSSVKIKHFFVN